MIHISTKILGLKHIGFSATLALVALVSSGCTVIKVVDVAASTAIGVTKVAVKTTGKVVGAAIPDGDDEDNENESDD